MVNVGRSRFSPSSPYPVGASSGANCVGVWRVVDTANSREFMSALYFSDLYWCDVMAAVWA